MLNDIGEWSVYDINSTIKPVDYVDIKALTVDNNDNIWVATRGEGFVRIEVNTSASPETGKNLLPDDFSLGQNRPNPFNPETVINYTLGKRSPVNITVYNIAGQKVAVLVDEVKTAGEHTVSWDGRDLSGRRVASGIYLYRMRAGDYKIAKKMIFIK
jgi:hypothetical protein